MPYTSCLGENQLVDVLESGRGNILSLLSNNLESLTFSQLGADDGLHFLGPIRGVLPIGSNGVPAFDTLDSSPLSDPKLKEAMLSYNYTLDLQGLHTNVKCAYDNQSHVVFDAVPDGGRSVVKYNGTCPGGTNFLLDLGVREYVAVNGNSSLGFWACKDTPAGAQEALYHVYLSGRALYNATIGFITCTVTPIQPAVFPVMYQSRPNIFLSKEPITTSTNAFTELTDRAVNALGAIIWESQNWQANLFAESVFTFGVKSFKLPPPVNTRDDGYLPLFEAMIQGILEYEATYIRLLYSSVPNPPKTCNRNVSGSITYQVIGWFAKASHIGFLMPMTLVNLTSLIILLRIMFKEKRSRYALDPTDPIVLLFAEHEPAEDKDHEWDDKVRFRTRDGDRGNCGKVY